MKRIFFLTTALVVGLFLAQVSYADNFIKDIKGPSYDVAESIQQTSDGGYIIAGWTDSSSVGKRKALIIKLDVSGNITWQKAIGVVSMYTTWPESAEVAYSIQQTSDGGYIVAGRSNYLGPIGDILLLKLDSLGNILWLKTIGRQDEIEVAYSIQQTSDGGYIVGGHISGGRGLAIKLDYEGNIVWQKKYILNGSTPIMSIKETSDSGYIMTGRAAYQNYAPYDIFVVKLNSSGDVSWQKAYTDNNYNSSSSIQETSDGGYILAGSNQVTPNRADAMLIKLDSSGYIVWQKTYGGNMGNGAASAQETLDGGYMMSGSTQQLGGIYALLVKLDSSGNISWQKAIGKGDFGFSGFGQQSQQTSDGGYVIAGRTRWTHSDDVIIMKLDASGNIGGCAPIYDLNLSVNNSSLSSYDVSGGLSTASLSVASPAIKTGTLNLTEETLCYGTSNHPPLANAGPDQIVNCVGANGAAVTLDGSGSSDPDRDELTYTWTGIFGTATGMNPVVQMPLGTNTVTLKADDGKGGTAEDTVNITVQDIVPPSTSATITGTSGNNGWYKSDVNVSLTSADNCSGVKEIHYILDGVETIISGSTAGFTISAEGEHSLSFWAVDNANNLETAHPATINIDKTAPVLNVTVTPGLLWPPNHKMVNITPLITVSDNLTSNVQVELVSVTSSEPDNGLGDGDTANDIVVNADGTISLRAERSGTGNGRVYTIIYKATDLAGNVTVSSATAIVPHDMGKK